MKKLFLVLISFLSISVLASEDKCDGFKAKSFCYKIDFKNGIDRSNDSEFSAKIFGDIKTENFKLEKVYLWMKMTNGNEHGSDPITYKLKENLTVEAKNVWFMMMGDWELIFEGKNNGKAFKDIIPVCVARQKADGHLGKCK